MIEIPGYRIQRVLGEGGMATVLLALQESVQREVALKVMAPTLVGAEFGERFLREARTAARLRHPHVVQVHDVGRAGELHYMAMEYLGGGPVRRRGEPRSLGFALRVIREIASALDYAHARGVIHRDIKPDNLLLREDGAAVLTDFGIARVSDAKQMTVAGMIMGTPHYMAPEQATGAVIDGRADLYSLGIVLHELLLDRVPYQADDWVAVGLMHISAPLPELPAEFALLQPLLDRLLAKNPDHRFATGGELVAAIEAIELRRGGASPPTPRPAVTVAAPVVPTPAPAAAPADDGEPTLGRLDDLLATPTSRQRRSTQTRAPAPRWPWAIVAVLLVLLAGTAWVGRDRLTALLPPTDYQITLDAGEQALRDGRLDAAREAFRSAQGREPDDDRARRGLQRVADGYLERARGAVAAQHWDDADRDLGQARELGVAADRLAPLEQSVALARLQAGDLATVLEQGRSALAAGHLDDGDGSALAHFRQALQMAPDNELARVGLRDTLSALLARARTRLDAGDLDVAERQIEAVAAIDPGHIELAAARAALSEARQQATAGLQAGLARADALLRDGHLTSPDGGARATLRALAQQYPDAAAVRDGLRRVAAALVARADRALADFEFERAAELLDAARDTVADPPGIAGVERHLQQLRSSRAGQLAGPLSAADRQRLAEQLAAAQAARERGELLAPPGDSAYDHYKAALAIDPNDAGAKAGIAALPGEARRRFETALGSQQLGQARGYVDALESLSERDPLLGDMKRRLARAYVGFANERLGAGEIARASAALDSARELDPDNAELPALRARLEQASR